MAKQKKLTANALRQRRLQERRKLAVAQLSEIRRAGGAIIGQLRLRLDDAEKKAKAYDKALAAEIFDIRRQLNKLSRLVHAESEAGGEASGRLVAEHVAADHRD